MNKKALVALSLILGIVFLALVYVYWTVPAQSLPAYLPGHLAGSDKIHFKHGIAALVVSVGLFIFAYFQTGPKTSE